MLPISNIEAALLGLLCENSMHAYEIEKVIEERDMRHWTEVSMSSIYKVLRKLEDRDLVASKSSISQENRVKKIYSVTDQGRQRMREKIREIISEWQKPIRPMDIALSNLRLVPGDEVMECFENYLESLDKMEQCYTELQAYLEGVHCPVGNIALARRPLHMVRAEREWLQDFLEEYLKECNLGTNDGTNETTEPTEVNRDTGSGGGAAHAMIGESDTGDGTMEETKEDTGEE